MLRLVIWAKQGRGGGLRKNLSSPRWFSGVASMFTRSFRVFSVPVFLGTFVVAAYLAVVGVVSHENYIFRVFREISCRSCLKTFFNTKHTKLHEKIRTFFYVIFSCVS
jgi:hypothetical protein